MKTNPKPTKRTWKTWLRWPLTPNKPLARYLEGWPELTFMDVAGLEQAKSDLQDVVDELGHPEKFRGTGTRPPRALILAGPPGTGKARLAHAVAGQAGVPFIRIGMAEFAERFSSRGAAWVRRFFEEAGRISPAVLFVDHLERLDSEWEAGGADGAGKAALRCLLAVASGTEAGDGPVVLAATRRPDWLPIELLQRGAFERCISVGLPPRQAREDILIIHTRGLRLAPDVKLGLLARTTTGLSGSDLAGLCNEAALNAARAGHEALHMSDFEIALDKLLVGTESAVLLNDHERQVAAYHAAGHALVAWLTPAADPPGRVTILPDVQETGLASQFTENDHRFYSQDYLAACLSVLLAGRAAEQVALGETSTLAEDDLQAASRLVRAMIGRWGMGELGLISLSTAGQKEALVTGNDCPPFHSQATLAQIDTQLRKILDGSFETTRALISADRSQLDRLMQALSDDETIGEETIAQVLGPRRYAAGSVSSKS
jgi:cell division protease FtsH